MSGKPKRDLIHEASIAAKSLQLDDIKKMGQAWMSFDLNGDGIVTTKEVFVVLGKLKINIPESEQQKIVDTLDRNHNGTIEFIEFVLAYEKGLFKPYGTI